LAFSLKGKPANGLTGCVDYAMLGLSDRHQVGSQIDFLFFQLQFRPDMISMRFYRPFGYVKQHGNFPILFPLADQIGDSNFRRGKIDIFSSQCMGKGGNDIIQVLFQYRHKSFLTRIQTGLF
jgi:hypothetical protein